MFDDFEIPTLIIEGKWDLLWWNPDRAKVMRKNHPMLKLRYSKSLGISFLQMNLKSFWAHQRFLAKIEYNTDQLQAR